MTLYQKLLYAPAEHVEAVRAEILQEAREPGSVVPAGMDSGSEPAERTEPGDSAEDGAAPDADGAATEPGDPAFLDPSPVSRSAPVYAVNGAELRDPVITTRAGEPVNCLAIGGSYRFRYDVWFEKDAFDVHYHTLVKTVTGL